MNTVWKQLKVIGDRLGLRITPEEDGIPSEGNLDGVLDGVTVRVEHPSAMPYLRVWAYRAAGRVQLSLRSAMAVDKLAGIFGRHDLEVGDPEFDGAFVIKSDDPERARALLGPALRARLLPWKDAYLHVETESVHTTMDRGDWWGKPEAIEAMLRALVALARVVDDAERAAAIP
jgi:hypothetical protein